jgi:RNA polymerase sigma factor (TIGR02999 family)
MGWLFHAILVDDNRLHLPEGRMETGEVTKILRRIQFGEQDALDELIPLVYGELRRRAARCLRHERGSHTLQPTALVHEAYLQLVGNQRIRWQDRAHFFAVAGRLMRRILVDHARARLARKRGGGRTRITLSAALSDDRPLLDLLVLDDALERLATLDARQASIVELRVLAGMTVEETAEAIGVSPRTVKSDWQMARAWLSRELRRSPM